MKKNKLVYACSECSYESLRWLGKCPQCGFWDSFVEKTVIDKSVSSARSQYPSSLPVKINEIVSSEEDRIMTGLSEFDRTLGGGFVMGSIVLIAGEPGIGKSTLILQTAEKIKQKVLYVTGEESLKQIKLRANRLNVKSPLISVLAETDLEKILAVVRSTNPVLLIIDSIQTMRQPNLDNSAGSSTQIRECTATLMDEAKRNNFIVVIIGHVTKEGSIAGPKILEHIVDTVIHFEGENNLSYRIVRALKNRYGSANEIGIFEMAENGLREVTNPSELFLGERTVTVPGTVVTAAFEGSRALLIEIQALVTPTNYASPARITTGFDNRRLSILLAVIERRLGHRLSQTNVFINIAGGLRVDEPAVDLAVCAAVISALANQPADKNVVFAGEVGLGGELRAITNIEKRIIEAEKLGFEKIVIPAANAKHSLKSTEIRVITAKNLSEAVGHLSKSH